eukprot:4747229-Prorocentrum_lima.AAC.1
MATKGNAGFRVTASLDIKCSSLALTGMSDAAGGSHPFAVGGVGAACAQRSVGWKRMTIRCPVDSLVCCWRSRDRTA